METNIEKNEEKLSTLFNNRFKESLTRTISEKNNKVLELEDYSKRVNKKSVLIDYSSQLLSEVPYTELIKKIIKKIKENEHVNMVTVETGYSNGVACIRLVIKLNPIDIDVPDEDNPDMTYLLLYPTINMLIENPVASFSNNLSSMDPQVFMNDENEISYEKCKALVSNIEIKNIYLSIDRSSRQEQLSIIDESMAEKTLEEKVDFVMETLTNKDYLLGFIDLTVAHDDIDYSVLPFRSCMFIKNSRSVIDEILSVIKICDIEEEEVENG